MFSKGLTVPHTNSARAFVVELRVISDIDLLFYMSAEEYLFQKAEDGTYVRKLFGQESMLATAA